MEYVVASYSRYVAQFVYSTKEGYSFKWTPHIKKARRFQSKTIAKILATQARAKCIEDPFLKVV